MMRRACPCLVLWVLLGLFMAACAAQEEPVMLEEWPEELLPPVPDILSRLPTPSPSPSSSETDEEEYVEIDWSGFVISPLTGLYIPEEAAQKRPVAVVINNLFKAHPQSGIAQADIVYEVLAEANITRMVAIFQDFDASKIGPVRSARDYFIDFALNHDAIFVHHGGSPSAYSRLSSQKIDRLDGMNLDGTYFWRDSVRWNTAGMKEHSSYTSADYIRAAAAKAKLRDTVSTDSEIGFLFNTDVLVSLPESGTALQVTVPFSKEYARTFTYDAVSKEYAVINKNGPHQDESAENPLSVKNILIQSVKMRVIPGDEAGRREVQTVGEGDGFWVAEGVYYPVRWVKKSASAPTRWYDANGNDLRLKAGKTWICVFQNDAEPKFEGQ